MNDLLKNAYNQFHSWFQSVGVFIVAAICYYLVEHDSADWTWKGLIVSAAAAFLTYGFTRDDHKKTEKAVEKAAVTGPGPTITEGELK